MYDDILLPVDGSDPANRAIEHGLELAERYGATVHAMYVVDTSRYGEPALSSTALVLEELEAEGRELIDRIADRADNHGVPVEPFVCHGTPHDAICDRAEEVDADVIVMGFQGHSHDVSEHLGSVADRVVRQTGRPVLLA